MNKESTLEELENRNINWNRYTRKQLIYGMSNVSFDFMNIKTKSKKEIIKELNKSNYLSNHLIESSISKLLKHLKKNHKPIPSKWWSKDDAEIGDCTFCKRKDVKTNESEDEQQYCYRCRRYDLINDGIEQQALSSVDWIEEANKINDIERMK